MAPDSMRNLGFQDLKGGQEDSGSSAAKKNVKDGKPTK